MLLMLHLPVRARNPLPIPFSAAIYERRVPSSASTTRARTMPPRRTVRESLQDDGASPDRRRWVEFEALIAGRADRREWRKLRSPQQNIQVGEGHGCRRKGANPHEASLLAEAQARFLALSAKMRPKRAAPHAAPPPEIPTTSTVRTFCEKWKRFWENRTRLPTPMRKSTSRRTGLGLRRSIIVPFLREGDVHEQVGAQVRPNPGSRL